MRHQQQEIVDELIPINNLCLSLKEELTAIIDYKNRASIDKSNAKLYTHLAGEECQHFAELLEKVVSGIPELDEIILLHISPK